MRTDWWVVDTSADAAYSWLVAQNPGGTGPGGVIGNQSSPGYRGAVSFTKPPTPTLVSRLVLAAVGQLSAGRSVLRVDVQEVYRPARPAAEVVPVTPYLVATILPKTTPNAPIALNPSPITLVVTDESKIAEIARLINALPIALDAARICPLDAPARIGLAFKSSANGATLATVTIDRTGCVGVSVTIGSTREPNLDPSAATYPGAFSGRIESILGVTVPGG